MKFGFLNFLVYGIRISLQGISAKHVVKGKHGILDADVLQRIITAAVPQIIKGNTKGTREISMDISSFVPELSRHQPIPTVYSIEEINAILESIDRTKRLGKRNYAIIMIAARTGLRSCDIADLKFDNIDRKNKTLSLVQKKTGEYIEMPLLDEVIEAINDYVSNERPVSDLPNIFLCLKNPKVDVLLPHTIYAIVSRTINKSRVDPAGRKRGAHALRSSLASHLLEEGNSYSVIQKVLGHSSPEAAKHYVKVELTRLRECALSVPGFPTIIEEIILREVLR